MNQPARSPRWMDALNPPIYLVSILPGIGVAVLSTHPLVHPIGLLLATIAVVLLQHAINLFNDATDWRLGADVEKYDSWVRVHDQRPLLAVAHGSVSLLLGGFLGAGVLLATHQVWILAIALPFVALGYLYNAGTRPLSYGKLGEWITGICYGPGVFGCLWLVAGLPVNATMLAGSLAFAALAVALLLSHQPPQIDTDRRAGKRTFAVRHGGDYTAQIAMALFALFLATVVGGLLAEGEAMIAALVTAAAIVLFVRLVLGRRVNPKRILMPASVVVLVGFVLRSLPPM